MQQMLCTRVYVHVYVRTYSSTYVPGTYGRVLEEAVMVVIEAAVRQFALARMGSCR